MSHPERRRSMFLAMFAALALGAPAFAAPSPATISISFGATTVPLNAAHDAFFLGVTSLTFTIANPNASTTLTGVSVTDPLPAGLEAVDLSLRTTGQLPGPGAAAAQNAPSEEGEEEGETGEYEWGWYFGSWDAGWWSPFDHKEMRDDRVVYVATVLWTGRYTATYIARATTPGTFIRPPAHAEEMYNPAVQGRSDGGIFTVTQRGP